MTNHAKRRRQQSVGRRGSEQAPCTAAELFPVVWTTLVDVIGPTATAAVLQRSVKRAAAARPGVGQLVISREDFVYRYTVPASWSQHATEGLADLRQLLNALWPLLMEVTGTVVLRRLRDVSSLRDCGVIPEDVTS